MKSENQRKTLNNILKCCNIDLAILFLGGMDFLAAATEGSPSFWPNCIELNDNGLHQRTEQLYWINSAATLAHIKILKGPLHSSSIQVW